MTFLFNPSSMTETSPPTVPDSASGETSLPPVSDENGANRPSLNQSPSTPTSDQKEVVNDPNPYDYLNRNEFTSERFKVEMRKLPRQLGVKVRLALHTRNFFNCSQEMNDIKKCVLTVTEFAYGA